MSGGKRWSDLDHKRRKVRRRAYARLVVRCMIGGDFRSVPWLLKKVVAG